jgi:hypothetical protein
LFAPPLRADQSVSFFRPIRIGQSRVHTRGTIFDTQDVLLLTRQAFRWRQKKRNLRDSLRFARTDNATLRFALAIGALRQRQQAIVPYMFFYKE